MAFVVSDPDQGGLVTISGHVNKRKHPSLARAVTSMTFRFGAPCYIKDIQYDLAALEAARLKAAPERIAFQEIPNRTSVEQQVTYKDTKSITTTKTLTFEQSIGLKLGSEISVGLPKLGEAKKSFELSLSAAFGQSYTNSSTQEVSWFVPVRVPAGKRIIATSTVRRYKASVPFTYTVAWYEGTKANVIRQVTLPGVYEGVHIEDLKHEFAEAPLD